MSYHMKVAVVIVVTITVVCWLLPFNLTTNNLVSNNRVATEYRHNSAWFLIGLLNKYINKLFDLIFCSNVRGSAEWNRWLAHLIFTKGSSGDAKGFWLEIADLDRPYLLMSLQKKHYDVKRVSRLRRIYWHRNKSFLWILNPQSFPPFQTGETTVANLGVSQTIKILPLSTNFINLQHIFNLCQILSLI